MTRKPIPNATHCRKGHEYTPQNTRYKSDGRRMCVTCTSHCVHGHKYTPENTYMHSNGTRACVTCRKEREARRDHSGANRTDRGCKHGVYPASNCMECRYARSVRSSQQHGKEPIAYDEFVKNKSGTLDYLSLTPAQARARRDFDFAVDTLGRPLCEKPVKIIKAGKRIDYYPHADFDPDRPPTVVEAAKMCMGCPVFDECATLGKALNAGKAKSDGVFAGRVYVNGKIVNNKE